MNINSICRTCQGVDELMNMFDVENEVLLVMLQKVAGTFIADDDLLPKQICSSCANSLKMAFEFIVQCQTTEEILRARLDKGIFDEETPHKAPDEWVGVSLSIKPVEPINLPSELDLNSIIVNEDYLEEGLDRGLANEETSHEAADDWVGVSLQIKTVEQINLQPELNLNKEYYLEETELIEKGIDYGIHKKLIDDVGIGFDENDIIEMEEEFLDEATDMAPVNYINEYSEEVIPQDTLKPDFVQPVAKTSKRSKRVSSAPKAKTNKPPRIKKKKEYICSICSANYINLAEFRTHRRTHLPYTCACKICDRQFIKGSGLKTHMEAHNGTKVQCHLCGKQCSSINLSRHIKQTHHNIRPHSCEVCGAQFARKSELKIHGESHTEGRNHTCDTCGKKFKTPTTLRLHKKYIHRPDLKHKQNSQRKYNKQKICICELCGKESTSISLHINHQKIHSDVKKFECKVCNKGFHFKMSLDTHMLSHTGEKPHTCDICGKGFRQSGHLTSHKLAIHYPGTRVFKCKLCKKSFTSSGTLKVHERIHTGDRPYKCDDCPSHFIDASGLKRHRRRVHGETLDSSAVKAVVLDENNSITIDEIYQDQIHIVGDDVIVDSWNELIESEL